MSAYSIALFLHLLGVLALFAGIGLEQTGVRRLRKAGSNSQVREWVTVLRGLRRIDAPAGVTVLASGGYLAQHGAGHHAWVAAGIVGMVLMAVLGAVVGRPRFLAIVAALPETDGPVTPMLRGRLHDPILWLTAAMRAALALGVVFNMVIQPEALGVVIALVVAVVIGAVSALTGNGRVRGAFAAND